MYTGCSYESPCQAPYGCQAGYGRQGMNYAESRQYNHLPEASQLESICHSSIEQPETAVPAYAPARASTYLLGLKAPEYFTADQFIRPGSTARFVGSAAEIQEEIKEAFRKTTGTELPEDIEIAVLQQKAFRNAHIANAGKWNEEIQGFSINGSERKVFAKAGTLDRLMLTIGHEIGHVLTPALPESRDEEAKAFAFSLAWMEAIRENNIAGIGNNILPMPAQNGLHDKAFEFVQRVISRGQKAIDAFLQLARGTLTHQSQMEE